MRASTSITLNVGVLIGLKELSEIREVSISSLLETSAIETYNLKRSIR